ncbi:Ig-like domain-containing protein [Ramlibacter sp. Leaf400]|uniref:Ig-like domain-containing protein n=1 Tax=Ramlibacter sp. Leaf400 TaxID=1736365 RepID=UPI0006F3AB5F|nr:Ig-like domain-containing protein [Ramlibacter sp. Leaf400]KQT11041.1 hypothetical protein ASG30_09645 [Ramlibacter sp. Leaf400]
MIRGWLGSRTPPRPRRSAPHAEWLEPRLLYSADAGALLAATTGTEAPDNRTLGEGLEYTATAAATPTDTEVRSAYALTPLQFEADAGQLGEGVDFAASGIGYAVRLGGGGQAELLLDGAEQPVRLELVGARDGTAVGENLLATRSNHLVGQDASRWITDIANYGSVRYQGVWDGIDIRYYGNQDQLEYDFLLAPGADASLLQLRFHGVGDVRLDPGGDLVLKVAGTDREIRFQAPISYQEGAQGRESVESRYVLQPDGTVRIVVGAYDTSRALVVDPVLTHASYFGEGGGETALGVAVGADGSVYVTGHTTSTTGSFGSRVGGGADGNEAYVARFNADLTSLIYATRIGGSNQETGTAIAVDAGGNAIVTGWTRSTDFVGVTAASDQATRNGTQDAFVVKLNAAGNGLVFSTYFGGSGNTDIGAGVAVGADGTLHVAGTVSGSSDNAFLNKYSATGTALAKLQFGGSGDDGAAGVAVDAAGNVYVAGNTLSSDLAITGGAQTTRPGTNDGFLVKYDATGAVAYSTYIGWTKADTVTGVAADDSGRAYVIGRTKDPSQGFPTTPGAFATTAYTHETGFLRIYDTALTGAASLEYSSFIGGSLNAGGATSATLTDSPTGVAVSGGYVAIVGTTDTSNFPTTPDAASRTNTSGATGFLIVLKPKAGGSSDLAYGTYYGTGLAMGGVAWGTGNRIYLVGSTTVNGLATADGYKPAIGSGGDGLVAVFAGFPNSAPVLAGPVSLPAQLEDIAGNGTRVADLVAGHVTDDDAGSQLGIAVTATPNGSIGGTWQFSLDDGATWLSLNANTNNSRLLGPDARVRFLGTPGGNVNGPIPGFTFRAWDGSSGVPGATASTSASGGTTAFSSTSVTVDLTITPVNDVPVRYNVGTGTFVAAPVDVTVNEGAALASLGLGAMQYITGYALDEYTDQALGYSVASVPGAGVGTVFLADGITVVTAGTSYTLAQIQGMRFLAAAGVQNAAGTFSWVVQDDGGTANGGVDSLLESITVRVRNVAPVLSGANAIPAVAEDAPGNGIRVADLVLGRIVDPGNSFGIAVTAAAGGSAGTWQYTSNGGISWTSLAAATSSSAVLLETGGQWRVRFNPSANWNGTAPAFTFRAWDRSTGTGGGTADTTLNGGTTAFSAATASASVVVGAVNDAPVRTDAPGVPLGPLILLDGTPTTSLGLAGVTVGAGGGTDEAGQSILGYTITALPSSLGTTYLADGTTPVVLGGSYTLAQIQGMQFASYGIGSLGTQAFSFAARDSGGVASGGADTATFSVNVVVNRAPVLNGANSPLTVYEDFDWTSNVPSGNPPPWATSAQRAGVLVADIIAGQVFDTSGSQGGIAVIGTTGSGTWQYTLDGGTTWTTLAGLGNTGALQLAADSLTRVRFLPGTDWNSTLGTAGITFRAWDLTVGTPGTLADVSYNGGPFAYSAATATSVVTVVSRNDAPVASNTAGGTVEEGAAPVTMLVAGSFAPGPATATDEAGQTLTFRFTTLPSRVEILLADGVTPVSLGTAYTLAQFQGMVFRSGPGATPGVATVGYDVQDSGGTDNGGTDRSSHTLRLTVTNRAPVLAGANPLAPVLEDTAGPGTLVADLVAGQVSDPTGTRGIAVGAVGNSQGSWQYTTDGGTIWTAFGSPSAGSARLLLADALTRVRFVPATDWNGTATLGFAAWDGTSGSAGGLGDSRIAGGSTAFSTATATASVTVVPVNDAPVGGVVTDLAVAEDSGSSSLGLGAVSYGPGGGADEAGQGLAFTLTALPPVGFGRITLADGTDVALGSYTLQELRGMRFVTAGNAVGTASFGFHVRDDGGGATDTLVQTVQITVNPVNDPPVTNTDAVNATEDQPLVIAPGTLLANDTDIDGDALTLTGVTSGTGGSVALSGGNIVFTPDADFNGTATFSYTVRDPSGAQTTGTVNVTVAPANDAPVANDDSLTAGPLTLAIDTAALLANDFDLEGDTLTVTSVSAASHATVTLLGNTVLFLADVLYTGPASFDYTVSDGRGGFATATVHVNVVLLNQAPTAGADTVAATEDTPRTIAAATLLANDSDPDLFDTLSITGVSAILGGTVSLSGGTITFTPDADFNGAARFNYTVSDGRGGSVLGTVTVNVAPVNDAPEIGADTVAGTEDQVLVLAPAALLGNDSDAEGDALTITGVASRSGGTVALVGGNVVFTPTAHATGPASFDYTVSDGRGGTTTGTVTVVLAAVNDAPAAAADAFAGTEDQPLSLDASQLVANDGDLDGDALAVTGVANGSGGTLSLSGTTIVFTPAVNHNGPATFSYTVSDGKGGTATGVVTVNLAPVNDAPVPTADTFTTGEDAPLTFTPAALLGNDTDAEGDTLSITGVTALAGGAVQIVGGSIVFTPDADFNGSASFRYTVSDGNGGTATGTVTVVVAPANDAPVAQDDTVTGTEDQLVVITPAMLLGNDGDLDLDTLGIVGLANGTGGTVAFSGANIVFTPDADFDGTASFHYTVSDGQGGTSTGTVLVSLAPVNDAPLGHADVLAATEDTPLAIDTATLLANDDDTENDTLAITGVANAYGGVVSLSGTTIVFTPDPEHAGTAGFTYTVSDGRGGLSSAGVTLVVAPVNDAPVVVGETAATSEDAPLVFTPGALLANDSDVEGDVLQILSVADGVGGQVNIVGGNVVFTPDVDFSGTASFSYTVSDGNGGTATAQVTVTVAAVNDAPVAMDDMLAGAEDTPLAVAAADLLSNDSDAEGQGLAITGVTAIAGGSVTLSGGTISFTPDAHFNGTARFSYTVSDGNGGQSTGIVTINLAAVDDAPVAVDDTLAATEDQPLTITPAVLLANDRAFDGETLALTGVTAGTGGTVVLDGGSIVFTPDAGFNGTATFSYTVEDGEGGTTTATVSVQLSAVNDAPVAGADAVATSEDQALTLLPGVLLANDSDSDGGVLSITGVSAVSGGSVALSGGSIVFTPTANFHGTASFTYTLVDGQGGTTTGTVTVTVASVDDATVVAADTGGSAEDNAATGNVLANDSDADDLLQVAGFSIGGTSYAAGATATLASVGSFTLAANGDYTFTPAANWNGSAPQVDYTTSTGAGGTLDLTVGAVDDATLVNPETAATAEDTPATGNVLANDVDVDTPLQVATFSIGGTSHAAGSTVAIASIGSFTLGASGDYVFTPIAHWNGAVPQVTYITNTGASSTLTLTVDAVDDATVAAADAVATNEDTAATGNVLANDSDADDALQVASFQLGGTTYAAGATATIAGVGSFTLGADGGFTFTPLADWSGSVPQVSYTTSTGATSTLAISVAAVDDATVATADTLVVDEDTVATGNVLANDTDVDSAPGVASFQVSGSTYAAGSTAALAGIGSFTLGVNGDFTFTPVAHWNGVLAQVSYTTTTGASSTLDIALAAIDDATVAAADTLIANEDTVATGNVLANDSDADDLLQVTGFSVGGTAYAAGATANLTGVGSLTLRADGSYTFTPVGDWSGTVPQLTYATSTGATGTLTVTVAPIDDASVLAPEAPAVDEDTVASGNVLANDTDVDTPLQVASFSIGGTGHAAGSTVAIAGIGSFTLGANGDYVFTPIAHWNGAVPQVTYITNTGASSTLTLTVDAVDDATVVTADTFSTSEDTAATGNVLANDSDADGALQVVAFTIGGTTYAAGATANLAGVGSFTLGSDGAFSLAPIPHWNGAVPQVSYTTSTGVSSTLDISVTPVDDVTVAAADTLVVDEDTVAPGNVLANDSDVDSPLQVASFTLGGTTHAAGATASLAGIGSFTLSLNGDFSFTPVAHWNGTLPQVSYTTTTGASSTLDVSMTAVDDGTVLAADTLVVNEDTSATGNVLANDSDVDSALSVASFELNGTVYAAGSTVALAGIGSFSLAATGDYVFTPVADWNGSLPVVSYATSTGSTSTLALTIAPVDDATGVAPDTLTVDEDDVATGNVLANDSDVDDALQVVGFSIGGTAYAAGTTANLAGIGGLTVRADGSYTFTPLADWNGTLAPITYTTTTGASSTLSVAVTAVDDASVLAPEAPAVDEDTVATGNVLANDTDVDTPLQVATFSIGGTTHAAGTTVALAGVGSFTLGANGDYVFTPAAHWNGAVPQVTYTTTTGASSTLTLTVDPVDDATLVTADAVTVTEDSLATGNVLTNDSDADGALQVASFTIAGTTYAAGATASLAGVGSFTLGLDGAFSFTPIGHWNGTVPQVSYTTSTGISSTLDISVTSVEDASVVVADTLVVDEDTVAVGNVLANDTDVDSVLTVASFQVNGTVYAAGGTATLAGIGSFTLGVSGDFSFTPVAHWNGTLPQVTYTTTTGASSTLDIAVTAVEDPTSAAADTVLVNEDTPATGNVLANDTDADSALSVASFELNGTVHAAGSTATIVGVGSFTLGVNGDYVFMPATHWNGSLPIVSYTTSTGATSTLAVTVTAVDDATVTAADTLTVDEDTIATGNVLGNDSDFDNVLQVTGFSVGGTAYAAGATATLAGLGSLSLQADGSYTFTPAGDWNGTVPQLTYTTSTGATSTLTVTVNAVDDATVVAADAVSTAEDAPATGNVLTNDSDVDSPLQVASFVVAGTTYAAGATASLAGVGSFTLSLNGDFSFTPVAHWNGTLPQVTYTTTTGASSTLDIAVTAVEDPTVVAADTGIVNEDTPATGNVLANDTDADSVLSVASFQVNGTVFAAGSTATLAGVGAFTLAATGDFVFTPASNWNGAVPQVSYTTSTGATGTLALTVAAVDDATVATADTAAVPEDSPATGNVLANDSDADDLLQVASFRIGSTTYAAGTTATLAGIGSFTLHASGAYTFTPLADWNGAAPQVAYTTSTGAGSTLDLAVTPVNDAPVRTSAAPAPVIVVEGSGAVSLGLGGLGYGVGGGADEATQAILVTVTGLPSGLGTLVLADGRTPVAAGSNYTLADLRGLRFLASSSVSSGTGQFSFSVRDDGPGPAVALGESMAITIVNQAPTLVGANALPSLAEDARDNAGMRVADLVAGQAADPLGRAGIAVIAAQGNGGHWEFSRDGGARWSAFVSVAAHDAELLAAAARLRFVPDADWSGDAGGLAFRAWDLSGGTAGSTRADTRVNGGSSAFSTGVAFAGVTVQAVNDAPVRLDGAALEVAAGAGGGTTPLGLGLLAYGPGGGLDESSQTLAVTITALPPPEAGTVLLADGRTAVGLGGTYTLADLRGMQFVSAAGALDGFSELAWTVRDDGGTDGGGSDRVPGALRIRVGTGAVDAPVGPLPNAGAVLEPPSLAPVVQPPSPVAPADPVASPGRVPAAGEGGDIAAALAGTNVLGAIRGFAPAQLQGGGDVDRTTPLVQVEPGPLGLADLDFAGDFLVTGFAGLESDFTRVSADQLQQALRSAAFVDELNRLRRQLQEEFDLDRSTTITVAGLSLGVSLIYVLWLIRGGVLVASYLSALPAWRLLDPLPVLARSADDDQDEDDDEALPRAAPTPPDPLRGFA